MGLLKEDEIASRTRMIGPWDYDSEEKMLVRETTFKDFKQKPFDNSLKIYRNARIERGR